MEYFDPFGTAFTAAIMAPNIIFALTNKEGFDNLYKSRALEIAEQIGRYGVIAFMVLNVPWLCRGFCFVGARAVYIWAGAALSVIYCLMWVLMWNNSGLPRALILCILPCLLFLLCGAMTLDIPLIAFSVLFAVSHITLSVKNAIIAQAEERGGIT